jgi:hypothetical protein
MTETRKKKLVDTLKDLAGLPPGRDPDGAPKPSSDTNPPRGTLTSEDIDNPAPSGTGIKPTE